MNVTVVTPHRNAMTYLNKYIISINALNNALAERDDMLHVLVGHGDSHDLTDRSLMQWTRQQSYVQMVDCTHGGPVYGSIVPSSVS